MQPELLGNIAMSEMGKESQYDGLRESIIKVKKREQKCVHTR